MRARTLVASLLLTSVSLAQLTFDEQAKLTASDAAGDDLYGYAVDVCGDTAVVGALQADVAGLAFAGAVYVYTRTGTAWTEQAKLSPSQPTAGISFGRAVAISGDTIVVGAFKRQDPGSLDPLPGEAWIFVRQGTVWSEQAKLQPDLEDLIAPGARFGCAVDIDADTIAVGAKRDGPSGTQGAAYVFVRSGTTWFRQERLRGGSSFDSLFGFSVAVEGGTVLVGAPKSSFGTVDVFDRSGTTWSKTATLAAGASDNNFGVSVDFSGDTAVVGANFQMVGGLPRVGAAHVFDRSGGSWLLDTTLTASDGNQADNLGKSVAISGDRVVAGAWKHDPAGGIGSPNGRGAAYVFERVGGAWIEQAKLLASDGAGGDRFSFSAAVDGPTLILGAGGNDHSGLNDPGAAYVFEESGVDGCVCATYCAAGVSAGGCSAHVTVAGAARVGASSGALLSVAGVDGGASALLLVGTSGRRAVPWGDGTSFACVAPPVTKVALLAAGGTTGVCDGTLSRDLNQLWTLEPHASPAGGALVQAQLWYRAAGAPGTGTLSDAVELYVAP